MATRPEEQEAQVRPLATAGLSTRKIADALNMSQPTVVRVIKRINSGPHPILQPTDSYPAAEAYTEPLFRPEPPTMPVQQVKPEIASRESRRFGWVLVVAAIVLAAIVAGAVWYKLTDSPSAQLHIKACEQFSPNGDITRIQLAVHNHCPAGWQYKVLIPS